MLRLLSAFTDFSRVSRVLQSQPMETHTVNMCIQMLFADVFTVFVWLCETHAHAHTNVTTMLFGLSDGWPAINHKETYLCVQ